MLTKAFSKPENVYAVTALTADATVSSAPGVGRRYLIKFIFVNNRAATDQEVILRDTNASGTIRFPIYLAKAGGMGSSNLVNCNIPLAENVALFLDITTASPSINVVIGYDNEPI